MVTTFPFASNEYMIGENREDRVADRQRYLFAGKERDTV